MKTNELTRAALNWAVHYAIHGECEGYSPYEYSTDWAVGGPIIEREGIAMTKMQDAEVSWSADSNPWEDWSTIHEGPTPLIAAMRCYVASKLGDEVDVPKELTC